MIRIHVGDIDIHFKVMADHECLYVFVHNTTESQENLRMVSGFVEFLKAGSMAENAGRITGITLNNFLDSVVKLLNLFLRPGDDLHDKRMSTCFSL